MASTGNKKKLTSTVAAVVTAAALLLGGTLAWQSANQTALNEASDVINPGGRLHDDFYIDENGDYNADIYVENFDKEDIYARVQLQEYMEVIMNYGTAGEKEYCVLGEMSEDIEPFDPDIDRFDGRNIRKATDGTQLYQRFYATRTDYEPITADYTVDAGIDKRENANPVDYWTWTMGSPDSEEVYFMPTFNKNKDSLVADRNGMYIGRIGGISNREPAQYEYTPWAAGQEYIQDAIYDSDYDDIDQVSYDFENLTQYIDAENIATVQETHIAKAVGKTNGFITMTEWLDKLNNGEPTENYWVWDDNDENGWIYWSSPIPEGESTGLLLDSIELKGVMDDTWYYAINAVAQFVTADDAGKADNTGFYDGSLGTAPSRDAETLLQAIGVKLSDSEEEDEPQTLYLELNYSETASVNANPGDKIILSINPDDEANMGPGDLSAITVRNNDNDEYLTEGEHYTYDPDTQTFVMLDSGTGYSLRARSGGISSVHINDNSSNLYGGDVVFSEAEEEEGPIEYRIYWEEEDQGTNYSEGEIAYLGDGHYQLFVMEEDGRYYAGEYPNDFEWEVDTDLAYTVDDVAKRDDLDEHYVSVLFTLDETVEWESEHTFTATNLNDGFTMTATVCYGEDPYSGGDDEYFDNPITVNGIEANSNGYIYLSGLDIDQVNSFDVNVHEDFDLAEDGLTYSTNTYVEDTKLTVNEDDHYTGTLTIAARDYQVVTITATDVNGDSYSVYVVPLYSTIIITPEMDGQTLALPSGSYTLQAEGFNDNENTTFALEGAKRCITDLREGQWRLSVSSYESSEDITLTATDGTATANIKLVVLDALPNDGPLYSYYINGKGETWSYAFMETQEYAWVQDDNYTYEVYAGMANDFEGVIDWTITGATVEGESVYFTDEAGTAKSTTFTGREPFIKFTAEQTEPFTLYATIYADAERSEIYTYTYYNNDGESFTGSGGPDEQFFTIIPVKNGKPLLRSIRVESDYADYYNPYYLAPGSYGEVYFMADVRDGDPISNADVTWSLVTEEEGCTFEITEDEDNYATVTHTCTEDSCTHVGAVTVMVSYDHAYGQTGVSEFYILPEDYAGDLEFEDDGGEDYEPELSFDGDTLPPRAQPAGTTIDDVYYEGGADYYAITYANNKDLEADENGYYTNELEPRDGLAVITIPSSYGIDTFNQYFYGEMIESVETDDGWVHPYTFELSEGVPDNSVETVTIVATELDEFEAIAQIHTKVFDSTHHAYAGSNSINIDSAWLLVFNALDENGNPVGYCVANAIEIPASVYPMYPASAYVTEGTYEDDFSVSDDFDITTATECTGTHGSSIEGAVLYSDDAELTQVSRGQSYPLSVKVGDEAKTVTSWRVKGAKSTATRFEGATLNIGHFEPADSLTILVTLEDEQYFNEFTVAVTGDSSLTDISDSYALAHPNGSDENAYMVYLSDELWPGVISDDNYVVEKDSIVEQTTTLADAVYLNNLSSIELVGNKLAAVTITGSWDLEDEGSVQFGIVDGKIVNFRTEDVTDEGDPLTLYVITADGRYIAHSLSVADYESA